MFTYVKNYLRFHLFFPLIFLVITGITYGNSLPNGLFFDDEELIYKNEYVKHLAFFPRYFTENMISGAGKVSNMYRPILLTSFALDYAIWKGNPLGFHLTNILLHATNGIFIFFLILRLFKNRYLAFLTSLFFVVHPANSEAVIYASGRTDPLVVFFSLLTFHFFLQFIQKKESAFFLYFFSFGAFLLALLTKETAVILPFLLFLLSITSEQNFRKKFMHFFIFLIPFFLSVFLYILLRLTVFNFGNTLNFYSTSNIYSQNIMVRFFTFTYVFFEYMSLLFFPKDLIVARSVPLVTSFFSPSVLLFLFLVFFLFFLSVKYWHKEKLFFFSLCFFFLAILPVSGIIPINNIITEHYLYFPSLSFFLFVSFVIVSLFHSLHSLTKQYIFISVLGFIFLSLSIRTIIRTSDWRDPITFYTRGLAQSPWHIPMRHNLAMAYSEKGEYTRAIVEYKKIIEEADVYPNTHHNLANVYRQIGKYQDAEEEYRKAIALDPHFYFSYYALLDLYEKTGEKEKEEKILQEIKRL